MKKHVFYFNLLKMQAMKGMKIWLVMVGLVCAVGAWGQGWMKTYEGDYPVGVDMVETQDSDSTFMILSRVHSVNSVLLSLIKLSVDGELIDQKYLSFDSLEYIAPTGIHVKSDGRMVVCGNGQLKNDPQGIGDRIIVFELSPINGLNWIKVFNYSSHDYAGDMIATPDDGYIICGSIWVNNSDSGLLLKIDSLGNEVWHKLDSLSSVSISYNDIQVQSDSNIVIVGTFWPTDSTIDVVVAKLDYNGSIIWRNAYGSSNNYEIAFSICSMNGEGYIVGGYNNDGIPFSLAIDNDGNQNWFNTYTPNNYQSILKIFPASGSGYYLLGYDYGSTYDQDILLIKINESGQKVFEKRLGTINSEVGISGFQSANGAVYVFGNMVTSPGKSDILVAKTDANGNIYSSALSGTLHQDPENDCLPDPTEPGLANWLVQATGAQSFATLTDSLGNFTLPVDTGNYEVTVAPPSPYWEICNSPTTASITAFYDTLSLDFPAQAITDCPYLTVDISAPFLRRCFDNNYYVHYCNDGTATANDAAVEVTLDPYLTYISSSIPLASQNGNTLTFDLGDVAVGDCGSFQITAYLDCDSTILGQTHCTSAHITPDSLCLQPDPLWDGSSIEVDASCSGDSIVFTITNVGSGGMPAPLGFIIIEDQIVLLTNDFQLGAGQSTTVSVPANGGTFHLEAQQAAAHPSGFASTGATIEGCGSWLSLGFFTQWSFDDDPDPFTDVDCQANVGSFDPNDKQGFPTGLGAAPTEIGVIEPEQDIEYLIRFQNTGTDTAFKVVIVDVLPPELDLATVRPGASSHAYTYGVTPEGWLTFTFENIQLPDSTTNEAASHGFIRFRASQRPGLGWGIVIANTALIYFDFNAPVQTNTFKHRIGQVFPWALVGTTPPIFNPKTTLKIVPNPLTDSALLKVEGIEPGPLNLVLTDVSGKILRQQTITGTGFEFQRGELNPGLYFFKIERNGLLVGSGKLMVK